MDSHGGLKRREQREVRRTEPDNSAAQSQEPQSPFGADLNDTFGIGGGGFGGSSRGEPLDAFITQSLNSDSGDNDPYRDLEKIFGSKS